jgi:hypothetical protein
MTILYIDGVAKCFKFFTADELVEHAVGPSDCVWIVPGTYRE